MDTQIKWMGKNSRPSVAGWFYVKTSGYISIRYFDDSLEGSWWHPHREHGFVPNESFDEWLMIQGITSAARG